jgi:hypothetical protein
MNFVVSIGVWYKYWIIYDSTCTHKPINAISNIHIILVVLDLGLGIIIDAQFYLHGINIFHLIDDDHYQ